MAISSALGSSALLPAGLGFRNKIINGAMTISQRGTSAISNAAAANTYGTDRWHIYGSSASKMTITQSTTNPTGQGFSNSTLVTSSAATTPGTNDYYGVRQYIEGSNMVDLAWGTSGAKPIVVSFWVRSSIAGTYSLALHNGGSNRSLVSTYTISAVDTWEKKTIYINAGDITGTWATDNSIGLAVWFDLGSGSSANGTAGVWAAGLSTRTSGSSNWVGTNGATFAITGVQVEQNFQPTPFEQRPFGVELDLCLRYYEDCVSSLGIAGSPSVGLSGNTYVSAVFYKVPKRIAATTINGTTDSPGVLRLFNHVLGTIGSVALWKSGAWYHPTSVGADLNNVYGFSLTTQGSQTDGSMTWFRYAYSAEL
jgi:hypothetical protein